MDENATRLDVDAAVGALEQEAQRQTGLREDLFGDGDVAGAKAASDLALSYRTAAAFLRKRLACRSRPPKPA
jgi:hypothetical protein